LLDFVDKCNFLTYLLKNYRFCKGASRDSAFVLFVFQNGLTCSTKYMKKNSAGPQAISKEHYIPQMSM